MSDMPPDDFDPVDPESAARDSMHHQESEGNYQDAALAALTYADYVGNRSPEGALALTIRAQVYATLHQAETALWIADNRQPTVYARNY